LPPCYYGRPLYTDSVGPLYFILVTYAVHTNGQAIIFYLCGFYLLSFFFLHLLLFSLPNLSGRRLDVYHTSTRGVALVRNWNAGLKYAARGSLEMQDAKNRQTFAIWAQSHKFVGLYLRNGGRY